MDMDNKKQQNFFFFWNARSLGEIGVLHKTRDMPLLKTRDDGAVRPRCEEVHKEESSPDGRARGRMLS